MGIKEGQVYTTPFCLSAILIGQQWSKYRQLRCSWQLHNRVVVQRDNTFRFSHYMKVDCLERANMLVSSAHGQLTLGGEASLWKVLRYLRYSWQLHSRVVVQRDNTFWFSQYMKLDCLERAHNLVFSVYRGSCWGSEAAWWEVLHSCHLGGTKSKLWQGVGIFSRSKKFPFKLEVGWTKTIRGESCRKTYKNVHILCVSCSPWWFVSCVF